MQGDVQFGGDDGFLVTCYASLWKSTEAKGILLTAFHAGGWSLFDVDGPYAPLLTTPEFTGSVQIGPGSYRRYSFAGTYLTPLVLWEDKLTVIGKESPGMRFAMEKTSTTAGNSSDITISLDGKLQIGNVGDMPLLEVHGSYIRRSEASVQRRRLASKTLLLTVTSRKAWRPFKEVPWLQIPGIAGEVTVTFPGRVALEVTTTTVANYTFEGNRLHFLDWAVECSGLYDFEDSDASPALYFGVQGKIAYSRGDTGDFVASVAGSYEIGRGLTVTLSHAGGWKPFSYIDYLTPTMSGQMRIDKEGLVAFVATQMADVFEIIPEILVLGAPPKDLLWRYIALEPGLLDAFLDSDNKGPLIGLNVSKLHKSWLGEGGGFFEFQGSPQVLAYACLPFRVVPEMVCGIIDLFEGKSDTLEAAFETTDGPIKPLGGMWFLPDEIVNSIVLHASPEVPLSFSIEVNILTRALGFSFNGTIELHMPMFDVHHYKMHVAVEKGPGSWKLEVEVSMQIALAIRIPFGEIALPSPLGELEDAYAVLSSGDGLYADMYDEFLPVQSGLSLIWRTNAPWTLCNDKDGGKYIQLEIIAHSLTTYSGAFQCDLNWETTVNWLPGFNLLRFSAIRMQLLGNSEQGLIQFSVGAFFELATGAAMCDGGVEDSNPECLRAQFEAELGWVTVPAPGGLISASVKVEGAWFNPAGLNNFALIDPGIGLGIQVTPTWPPVVIPELIEFSGGVYWKLYGEWPAQMLSKDYGWPPDIGFPPPENMVVADINFFFEKAPHGEAMLDKIKCPRVGVYVLLGNMKVARVPQLLTDMALATVQIAYEAVNPTGTRTLSFPGLPAFIDTIFPLEFDVKAEVSLVKEGRLSRQIMVDGYWKDLQFCQYFFDIKAAVLKGDFVPCTAWQIMLRVFKFDVGVFFKVPVPSLEPDALLELISSPFDAVLQTGIGLNATAKLPFGLGEVFFAGYVSVDRFLLAGSTVFPLLGFKFDASIYFEWLPTQGTPQLSLSTFVWIPHIGSINLIGAVVSEPAPAIFLTADFDMSFLGICMHGYIRLNTTSGMRLDADIYSDFGVLGTFTFVGEVSPSSPHLYLHGQYLESDEADAQKKIWDAMFNGIASVVEKGAAMLGISDVSVAEDGGGASSALRTVLTDWLSGAFVIRHATATIETEGGLKLSGSISATLNGQDIEFGPWDWGWEKLMSLNPFMSDSRRRALSTFMESNGENMIDDADGTATNASKLALHGLHDANGYTSRMRRLQPSLPFCEASQTCVPGCYSEEAGCTGSCSYYSTDGTSVYCGCSCVDSNSTNSTNSTGRSCPARPFQTMEEFVEFMKATYSYDAIIDRMGGSIDHTIGDFGMDGFLDFAVQGSLRLLATHDVVSLFFSASFSFLGVSLSGQATLTSGGSIASGSFDGTGVAAVPGCDACPSFEGRVNLAKGGLFKPATLSMFIKQSFLGLYFEGAASFQTWGGLQSLRLEGDAAIFTNQLKNAMIKAMTFGQKDASDTDNLIVKGLTFAFETLAIRRLTLTNDGGVFMVYTFELTVLGEDRTLSLQIPRVPTSLSDLAELLTTYSTNILQAIAPIDIGFSIGDGHRAQQLCTEQSICTHDIGACGCDCGVPYFGDECNWANFLGDACSSGISYCALHYTDGCSRVCAGPALDIDVAARLVVLPTKAEVVLSTSLAFGGDSGIIPWPSFSRSWSVELQADYSGGVSLCDVVPAVGSFVRGFSLGGGEPDCIGGFGIDWCIEYPEFKLSNIIDCGASAWTIG